MKRFLCIILAILSVLVMSFVNHNLLYAGKEKKTLEEWTNFGCGIGHTLTDHGPGYSINLSFNFGRRIFYQAALSVTDGSLSSKNVHQMLGIKPIPFHNNYFLNTISVGIGQRRIWNNYLAAIFVGPSINSGKIKNPDVPNLINEWSNIRGMGLLTNLQFIMRPKRLPDLAFGFELYSNFNKAKNSYGYRFSISLSNVTKKEE